MNVALEPSSCLPIDPARHVWIFIDSNFRWVLHQLACDLVDTEKHRVLLIVGSEQGEKLLRKEYLGRTFRGDIALAPQYPPISTRPRTAAEKIATIAQAKAIEADYGIDMMRNFVQQERALGRAFLSGSRGYPESGVSRAANEDYVLRSFVGCFDHTIDLFKRYPPALCLGFSIALNRWTAPAQCLLARAAIPLRTIVSARISGKYYWADDLFESNARFTRAFQNTQMAGREETETLLDEVRPNYANEASLHNDIWQQSLRWPVIARDVIRTYIRRTREHLARSPNASHGMFASGISAMYIRTRIHRDRLRRLTRGWQARLADRDFVFFPLQTEPETSLHSQSPEFSHQYHALRELALSLPAGYLLAVKEHKWAIGRRHWSFYENIAAIPNVVLVDIAVPGIDLVRQGRAVGTISGSAGHEAALMGKPVIRFGRHNPICQLDHVHVIKSVDDLKVIRKVLSPSREEAEKARIDGARYIKTLRQISFDLIKLNVISKPRTAEPELLDALKTTLAESLRDAR